MNIVNGSSAFPPTAGVSVTIGNFDGVHLGHQELLRRTVARANAAGTSSVALTFTPHPIRFFRPHARLYEITSLEEKTVLIAKFGIDTLVVEPFTGEVGRMWPAEFAREVLARLGEGRLLTTPINYVRAIQAGLLSVAEADADKTLLASRRFVMRFASFADLLNADA